MTAVPVPDYLTDLASGDFELIPCPLCGGEDLDPVYEGVALRGNVLRCVVCRRCTHLFLSPRPTMEAMTRFYEGDDYFELCANFSEVPLEEKLAQFDDEEFWRGRFVHGERLHDEYLRGQLGPGDTVFDFGCGDGAWLWALRELTGCEVDGEEISDVYVDVVRKRLGIDIFLGPAEELTDAIVAKHEGSVKLAIVSGSLQHMLDPMSCLQTARRILADDGFLYVCNWSVLEHYITSYDGDRRRLMGETLSWEHVHYFHEASFRYMLEASGFEVLDLRVQSSIRPRHMDAFMRKADMPAEVGRIRDHHAVVARLRALESATIADRIRER